MNASLSRAVSELRLWAVAFAAFGAVHLGCGDQTGLGGGQLLVEPFDLTFSPTVGQTDEQTVTLTNVGTESLVLTDVAARGESEGLVTFGLMLPLTLAPGESTTFLASYEARDCAAREGLLRLRTLHAVTAATDLPFHAPELVGRLVLRPEAIDFGEVPVGTVGERALSLTNVGTCSVRISDLLLTGSDEYRLRGEASGEDSSAQLPLRLLPGEVLALTVLFEPFDTGCGADGPLLVVRTDDAATRPDDSLRVEGCGTRETR